MLRRSVAAACAIFLAACAEPTPTSTENPSQAAQSGPQSASAEPAPTSRDIDLAATAWWATEQLGFGTTGFEPPNPAVMPEGFRQLSVGTLDGAVQAVVPLHWDWSHSYVAGPYGTDVLVANDRGERSEVYLISALDGGRTDLFETRSIVAAAVFAEGQGAIYTVELDRDTGRDTGLWRREADGSGARLVLPGPLGEPAPDPVVYWLTGDPLEDVVVVQWCFGQQRCTTTMVGTREGPVLTEMGVGWPLGADRDDFIGDGLRDDQAAYGWSVGGEPIRVAGARASVPVPVGGEWWFAHSDPGVPNGATFVLDADGRRQRVPGEDAPATAVSPLGERRGVALPSEWVMRWPDVLIFELEDRQPEPRAGQLVRVTTGDRLAIGPFRLVEPAQPCPSTPPDVMPSGRPAGFGVLQHLDGIRQVAWGAGDDMVRLDIGNAAFGDPGDIAEGVEVTVDGHLGRAFVPEGGDAPVLTWVVDECAYTAYLPATMSLDDAIAYSSEY